MAESDLKIGNLLIDYQKTLYGDQNNNCFDCPLGKECNKYYETVNIVLCAADHEEFVKVVNGSKRYGDGSMDQSESIDILKNRVKMFEDVLDSQIVNLYRKERDLEYRLKNQEIDYYEAKKIIDEIEDEIDGLEVVIRDVCADLDDRERNLFSLYHSIERDITPSFMILANEERLNLPLVEATSTQKED